MMLACDAGILGCVVNDDPEPQGCQICSLFHTKNNNFGISWKPRDLIFYCVSWPIGIFIDILVYFRANWYFVAFWYIFLHFGELRQENSGSPSEAGSQKYYVGLQSRHP
jgi:hypothetical protein